MANGGKELDGIDNKIPWWDGEWSTFSDYTLRVELRADATKKDELGMLGPRLAGNLIGKAFDSLVDVNREELRKETGWRYLLDFLETKRGKEKIDLLGDLFSEFFLRKESHRRENEDLSDYLPRFRQLVRRLEKAVRETGTDNRIPDELYGWFLLNVFMKMDASDTANVRGRSESYKLEAVVEALKKMWSGGGLCTRDQERKKRRDGQTYLAGGEKAGEEESEHTVFHADDGFEATDPPEDDLQELEEATAWFQDSLEAVLEEPTDGTVLANFKEARRALDQARTARGFYPIRNPNIRPTSRSGDSYSAKGFGKKGAGSSSNSSFADKICLRCGRKGHIARICPQRPQQSADRGKADDKIGFVGHATVLTVVDAGEMDGGMIFGESLGFLEDKAIIDSGASGNIIGVEAMQDLMEQLEKFGYVAEDYPVDRRNRKRFTFGNSESNAALGKIYIPLGIFGQEVEVEVHLVEGRTPFLLSARFLADMNATVNFRTGTVVLKRISSQHFQLERTSGNHLVLPITAFPGHEKVFHELLVDRPDPRIAEICSSPRVQFADDCPDAPEEGNQTREDQH